MQLKDKLTFLTESKIFKDWQNNNKDSFLAHIFRMFDEANKDIWQFGYYNKEDTITTFILDKEAIKEVPQEKIFKKDDHKLIKLNVEKIKISFEDALDTATKLHDEKYKPHPIMKTFTILQHLEEGQVFNLTFMTKTFNTINIHIDSESGSVTHEKLTPLMEMAKFEKGKEDKPDYVG